LACSITLTRIASTLPHKTVTIPIVTLIFLTAILWAAPRQARNVLLTGSAVLAFVYCGDVCLALVRGAQDGAYSNLTSAIGKIGLYLTTLTLGMVAVASARDRAERDERLIAVLLAPAVYAAVNLLLSLAGMQNPVPAGATAGGQDQLLSFVGVGEGRQVFPLTTSINLYSIVASASVAGLVVMRLRSPERLPRAIAWLGIVVCLYEVLAGDSRATLAVTVAVIALFVLRRRFAGASGVAALIPFFPLIIIGALDILANTGIADVLGRGGNFGSVASGTGRVYIWKGTWEVLRHFELQHLIGWGAAGQIPSGASIHYAFVFAGQPLAYTVFTHDVVLQTILDEGYIGLAIFVAVIWRTFLLLGRHVRREPGSPAAALIAMLLVIVLSGATEVSPSYYAEEVLLMTFLISGVAAALAVWVPGGPTRAFGRPM
jgi:hypothetical protein